MNIVRIGLCLADIQLFENLEYEGAKILSNAYASILRIFTHNFIFTDHDLYVIS